MKNDTVSNTTTAFVWILTVLYWEDPDSIILGAYQTKEACQKAFKKELDALWDLNYEMDPDNDGRNKAECIEALDFCSDRLECSLKAELYPIKK